MKRKAADAPVDQERWDKVQANLRRYTIVHCVVPYMLMLEYWSGVRACYGTNRKALVSIARYSLRRSWNCALTRAVLIVTDGIGWTKVYFYPETDAMPAYHRRHGWRCSGSPNCDDEDCINRAIPPWFKRLTRWED